MEETLDRVVEMKKEVHGIFSQYMVRALENRTFDHLTGNADEKPKKGQKQDFTPIFESLIDNEYEF